MGGGGSQSSGEGWAVTSPGFMNELSSVLNSSLNGTSGFTKQDAVNDIQGTLKQQATDALQASMPKIAASQNTAGAYNSTTKALLGNDLQARITGQLAATQADAIKNYAAIDADRIRAFSAATQAGTSTASQHFESAASANQSPLWNLFGGTVGGIGRAVAGATADKVSNSTGFADGGVVKDAAAATSVPESVADQLLNDFKSQLAPFIPYDPGQANAPTLKPGQFVTPRGKILTDTAPTLKVPGTRDKMPMVDQNTLKNPPKKTTKFDPNGPDDELFNLIGTV